LTLYVRIVNVMDRENVFIAWDHDATNVKYFPCVFEKVYVLDVSLSPKTCCTKTFLKIFMFTTHKIILTQYDVC
jgi:hypothetical protein